MEAQAKSLNDKIDRAGLKDDYIQQIQKQYETYYEKAFSTQLQILGILGLILSVLLFLAGRFGFKVFDRQIQLEIRSATDALRLEFENRLGDQLRSLAERNSAQLQELEGGLRKRLTALGEDLQLRSDFHFEFSVAMGAYVDKAYDSAINRSHRALELYKQLRKQGAAPLGTGTTILGFVFQSIMKEGEQEDFPERAKNELKNDLYQDLDEELTVAASRMPDLLPLLSK